MARLERQEVQQEDTAPEGELQHGDRRPLIPRVVRLPLGVHALAGQRSWGRCKSNICLCLRIAQRHDNCSDPINVDPICPFPNNLQQYNTIQCNTITILSERPWPRASEWGRRRKRRGRRRRRGAPGALIVWCIRLTILM